jgi:hypothetical protein
VRLPYVYPSVRIFHLTSGSLQLSEDHGFCLYSRY